LRLAAPARAGACARVTLPLPPATRRRRLRQSQRLSESQRRCHRQGRRPRYSAGVPARRDVSPGPRSQYEQYRRAVQACGTSVSTGFAAPPACPIMPAWDPHRFRAMSSADGKSMRPLRQRGGARPGG